MRSFLLTAVQSFLYLFVSGGAICSSSRTLREINNIAMPYDILQEL